MLGGIISGALGALGGIMGGNSAKKAAAQNAALAKKYKKEGLGYIDEGSDLATGYLNDAGNIYSNLATESGGLSGLNMYANALGINGADGTAAAQDAYSTSPGYQFALDQGLQALSRTAAAQGRLQSGQTGIDTMNYAIGSAQQDYNNWLSNLSNYGAQQSGIYTGALTGQATSLGDLASLATNAAGQKVDLIGNTTSALMGANNQSAAGTSQQWQSGLSGLGKGLGSIFGALS